MSWANGTPLIGELQELRPRRLPEVFRPLSLFRFHRYRGFAQDLSLSREFVPTSSAIPPLFGRYLSHSLGSSTLRYTRTPAPGTPSHDASVLPHVIVGPFPTYVDLFPWKYLFLSSESWLTCISIQELTHLTQLIPPSVASLTRVTQPYLRRRAPLARAISGLNFPETRSVSV